MNTRFGAFLIFCFFAVVAGCGAKSGGGGQATAPATQQDEKAASSPSAVAACTTITSAEIEAVQGEPVKETKGNDSIASGLAISHCVYLLPSYAKSISLDILRGDPQSTAENGVKKFWELRFRQSSTRKDERDKDEQRAESEGRAGRREEEGEKENGPRPVPDIGDEAFWVGSRIKGTLYVLRKDVVIILSVGGAEDEATKIKTTTSLAQHALKRL